MKIIKSTVAVLFMLALASCASFNAGTSASPRMRVAAASADFLILQEGIKGYLLLPPCTNVVSVCKSPSVVAVLQKGNATASAALDYAENVVIMAGVNPTTIDLAVSAAVAAVNSLKDVKTSLGVR